MGTIKDCLCNQKDSMFWQKITHWLRKSSSEVKKTTSELEAQLNENEGIKIPATLTERLLSKIYSLPIYHCQSTIIVDRFLEKVSLWSENEDFLNYNSLMVLGEVTENFNSIIQHSLARQEIKEFLNTLDIEIIYFNSHQGNVDHNIDYFDQKISDLKSLSGRKIIVIDNITDYFSRSVKGLQLLEHFFEFYLEDKEKFWLIGCHHWLYLFLDKIYRITAYFQDSITLTSLSWENLQEIFEPVLEIINFEWDNLSIFNIELPSNKEENFNKTKEIYFKKLAILSQGSLTLSIELFLRSLRYYTTEEDNAIEKIKITAPDLPNLPNINQLDRYLLYCVGLHKTISKDNLIMILAEHKTQIINQLNHLLQVELIEYNQGIIKLNYLYYLTLVKNLKDNRFPV